MMPPTAERVLAELAARQLGLFTSEQARVVGLTTRAMQHREKIGRIRRVHPRVFAVEGAPVTFQQRVRAATLGIEGAVASHESAALLHHFDPLPGRLVVVTVPRGGSTRLEGVIVHRSDRLPDRHVSSVNGIPTTSVSRTLLDLARVVGIDRLARMVDDQMTRRTISLESLIDEFDDHAVCGRRGISRMRRVLVAKSGGSVVPASELERRFHELLGAGGIVRPTSQFHPPWGGSLVGRVDFAFVERQLVVELDGRLWHSRDQAFEIDRRRDQLALMAGWRVLRFTWRQVTRTPEVTLETLRVVLAQ